MEACIQPEKWKGNRLQGNGVEVLSGDVDSDGGLDLVVLDPQLGGVHVAQKFAGRATDGRADADDSPTGTVSARRQLSQSVQSGCSDPP